MFSFIKNVLIGTFGLVGIILAALLFVLVGGFLYVLVASLGLIGYGIIRFLFGIIAAGALAVFALWLLGAIMQTGHSKGDK